jgi:hypothetical protein
MAAERSALTVCTAAPCWVTVTLSSAAPTSSFRIPTDRRSDVVRTTLVRSRGRKSGTVAVMVYAAAGRSVMTKSPASSEKVALDAGGGVDDPEVRGGNGRPGWIAH